AGGTKGPSASVTVTTLSPVEREVEAAYLKSWDVYADAALRLDPSALASAYAGAALDVVRSDIEHYRAKGTPARYRVDHDYRIELQTTSTALVIDRYVNHSVLLDPQTQEPIERDPNKVIGENYRLERH